MCAPSSVKFWGIFERKQKRGSELKNVITFCGVKQCTFTAVYFCTSLWIKYKLDWLRICIFINSTSAWKSFLTFCNLQVLLLELLMVTCTTCIFFCRCASVRCNLHVARALIHVCKILWILTLCIFFHRYREDTRYHIRMNH